MLVMAASTLHKQGIDEVVSLVGAHQSLEPILGAAAGAIFAVALLGSGLSSSAVGTLAGQVVMQGFIRRQIPVVGPANGDDDPGVRRRRDRGRPVADARALTGRAVLRDPLRPDPARLVYLPP